MGRQDQVGCFPEWTVSGKWFLFGHIETSTGDLPIMQGFTQRRFVDNAAARDIDQISGRLHQLERFLVNEVVGRLVGLARR